MTPAPPNALKELADKYPIPSEDKLVKRTESLGRMANFYKDKATEAPISQSALFSMFVVTLHYAITTIKMYRGLTTRLHELTKEQE